MYHSRCLFVFLLFFIFSCAEFGSNSDLTLEEFELAQKPENIILMIGDGMGLSQFSAAMIYSKRKLALEQFKKIGLVKTHSTKLITDSAASATAMATGNKTYNGAISMDKDSNEFKTILEYAEEANIRTGIITTTTVTHATPACFYGHQPTRSNVNQALAAQFMEKDIEVLAGGGWNYFRNGPEGRDLIKEAEKKGYHITDSIGKMGNLLPKKLLCLISPLLPQRDSFRGEFLPQATQKSIQILDQYSEPFFMVVEGGQIDWGGHENETNYIISELLDFDKSVEVAYQYAKEKSNTLIIVTADHETGGFSINDGVYKENKLAGAFTSTYHTASMVPIFAFGPGAAHFQGVMDNTEIFFKIKQLMQL